MQIRTIRLPVSRQGMLIFALGGLETKEEKNVGGPPTRAADKIKSNQ